MSWHRQMQKSRSVHSTRSRVR